jgi:hypothetical protein
VTPVLMSPEPKGPTMLASLALFAASYAMARLARAAR